MKNIRIFYLKICQFLVVKFSIYLNRRVFIMYCFLPGTNVLLILLHETLLTIPTFCTNAADKTVDDISPRNKGFTTGMKCQSNFL